ncbi:hypothetical protein BANRA_03101 [Escherichia coli]|nr:hypothetical protein BANRA_03101 [Escherichia coli]
MNYEEGNNIYTEIEFFTHYFLFKTTISIEIIKAIIKSAKKYLVLFAKSMVTL